VAAAQAAVYTKNASNAVIDGQFGQATYSQIFSFQQQRGLSADGCAGPQTWAALQSGIYKTSDYGQHPNLTLPQGCTYCRFANFDFTRYSTGCFWTYIHMGGAPEGAFGGSVARYQYYRFLSGSFATYGPSNQHLGCY
jgi:hypothetical protein